MSSSTSNFNLKKDSGSDQILQTISDLSANMDIIDSEIQNRKTDLTTHKTATTLDHPDGSVVTSKLADKGVTTVKLADQAVTLPKIDPTLLTNVAGNQNNTFSPNSYSWVATANQQTFTLPANTLYTIGFIWVNVGGIDQTKDAFTATDGVTFTVAEPLTAGTKVDARWYQGQLVSQAHHTTHYTNGADAIDVTQLQNYSSAVDSRIVTNTNQIGNLSKTNVSIFAYGAKGDGITDDSQAFLNAIADGGIIRIPGNYTFLIKQTLTMQNGVYFKGAGWGLSSTSKSQSKLVFAVPNGGSAIIFPQGNSTGYTTGLENLYIYAQDWTNHTGYGIEIVSRAILKNIYIEKFPNSNIFLHNDATGNGPYQSLLENVKSGYSQQHGCLIGTGANNITLINYEGFYNGSSSYGTAPTIAGNYDGLCIRYDAEGNPNNAFYSYVPEGITIVGGDCSYNARYGWNFLAVKRSRLMPSYAEHNVGTAPTEVHVGVNMQLTLLMLGAILGDEAGVFFDNTYTTYNRKNTIFVGGHYVGGGFTDNNAYILNNLNPIFAENTSTGKQMKGTPSVDGSGNFTGDYTLSLGGGGQFTLDQAFFTLPKQSACKVYQTTAQTISSGAYTKIQFQSKAFDNQSEFDNTTNYQFTATKAGIYQISCTATISSTTSGAKTDLGVYVNGANVARLQSRTESGVFSNVAIGGSTLLKLNAGDTVTFMLYTNTGSITLVNDSQDTFASIHKLS